MMARRWRGGWGRASRRAGFAVVSALGFCVASGCSPVTHAATSGPADTNHDGAADGKLDEFVVMSFNIRYGTAPDGLNRWELRRPRTLETIRRHAPDLLGVQEALKFQVTELLAEFPRYAVTGVGRDDGKDAGEHAAIFFDRERFERVDGGTFWLSDTPDQVGSRSWGNSLCRICTWVELRERETGRRLAMYNVHFDHESAPSRLRSAELLLDTIAKRGDSRHVIVTGDFNAGESSPPIQLMLGAAEGGKASAQKVGRLVDTYRVLHRDAVEAGTFNTWVGTTRGSKIDYVMVPDGSFGIKAALIARDRFDGFYPSDHFPVLARLQWPAAAAGG